jgi:hypothetical protein
MTEKRWFQKPEFLFTIFAFAAINGLTFWRSTINQAKADTDQRRDFEEFRRNQDSFNKGLLDRMSSFEKRQDDVLKAWNTEHDGVNTLTGLVGTLRKEYDSFVLRHDEDERTQNAYQTNTRERVIKLEAKQP